MNRQRLSSRFWLPGIVATALVIVGCNTAQGPLAQGAIAEEITVYRSPTCGCCGLWIEHMQEAGFQVRDEITEDMTAVKERVGLPGDLSSCHTTVADGYVIEGHVPAEDVVRLLTEKPDVAGIAVPGMPIGSPGMESGDYVEPYTVFSFSENGDMETFAEHS